MKIDKELYSKELLKDIKDLKYGLEYLIKRNTELQLENKNLREMYENRVNEYLKLKEKASIK